MFSSVGVQISSAKPHSFHTHVTTRTTPKPAVRMLRSMFWPMIPLCWSWNLFLSKKCF